MREFRCRCGAGAVMTTSRRMLYAEEGESSAGEDRSMISATGDSTGAARWNIAVFWAKKERGGTREKEGRVREGYSFRSSVRGCRIGYDGGWVGGLPNSFGEKHREGGGGGRNGEGRGVMGIR